MHTVSSALSLIMRCRGRLDLSAEAESRATGRQAMACASTRYLCRRRHAHHIPRCELPPETAALAAIGCGLQPAATVMTQQSNSSMKGSCRQRDPLTITICWQPCMSTKNDVVGVRSECTSAATAFSLRSALAHLTLRPFAFGCLAAACCCPGCCPASLPCGADTELRCSGGEPPLGRPFNTGWATSSAAHCSRSLCT